MRTATTTATTTAAPTVTPAGTSLALHVPPAPEEVAREQLRAVGVSLRREAALFLAALAIIGFFAFVGMIRGANAGAQIGFEFVAEASLPMVFVALLLPFSVWRSEDPSRRGYHLAMPIDAGTHTLARVAAGWVWLMAAVALFVTLVMFAGVVMPLLVGQSVHVFDGAGWQWMVPFTAATVSYLLSSIAVVGSEHPWRWIGGVAIGYALSQGMLVSFGLADVGHAIDAIRSGRYGLTAGAFAQVNEMVQQYPYPAWVPGVQRWIGATLIWGAVGLAGVVLVARRRRDI
jgi:hypothetical protein